MLVFQEIMAAGGIVMWVLLLCSLLAVFIILERWLHYHRARVDVPELLHGLFNVLKRNNVLEAISICDNTPGPVAHVLRSAILRCNQSEERIRHAVEEATLAEVPRLERNLKALGTIAHVTPLLGLLGTVLGMIGAFQTMEAAGPFVTTRDLAQDIWMALVTTAGGLTVAIPAYAFYNFLLGRVQNLILDMEKGANEMIHFLSEHHVELPDTEQSGRGKETPRVPTAVAEESG